MGLLFRTFAPFISFAADALSRTRCRSRRELAGNARAHRIRSVYGLACFAAHPLALRRADRRFIANAYETSLRRSKPMTGPLRVAFIIFCGALPLFASLPSMAQQIARRGASSYDGAWSVVIQTTRGDCPAGIRAGVRIVGGHVVAQDQSYSVAGLVTSNGAIRVNVSAAGQSAGGFGHMTRKSGHGLWRTSTGECSGRWTAERRS